MFIFLIRVDGDQIMKYHTYGSHKLVTSIGNSYRLKRLLFTNQTFRMRHLKKNAHENRTKEKSTKIQDVLSISYEGKFNKNCRAIYVTTYNKLGFQVVAKKKKMKQESPPASNLLYVYTHTQ